MAIKMKKQENSDEIKTGPTISEPVTEGDTNKELDVSQRELETGADPDSKKLDVNKRKGKPISAVDKWKSAATKAHSKSGSVYGKDT